MLRSIPLNTMTLTDLETLFHSQQAEDLRASNLSSSQCTGRVLANLLCSPVAGEISVAVQTQREEIDSQESVCIFHVCLFISSHLQKLLSCQGLQGCEASPLTVLAGRASLLDHESPEL